MFTFPEKGLPNEKVMEHLEKIKNLKAYPETSFSAYSTDPHPVAIDSISRLLPYNRNNIGTHTRIEDPKRFVAKLEKETVIMLGELMGDKDTDGYITQGGTEGNIMGLWIGRNMLRRHPDTKKICLIKTALTHYSIEKAVDILALDAFDIPLNEEYGMDAGNFEKKVRSLAENGYTGFVVVLTLGYNITGTVDPIDEIDASVKNLEKELPVVFYTHIDAAIGGMVHPFISKKQLGFNFNSVNSISIDMHKNGFVPRTAGVFLCRKGLQKNIERDTPYINYGIDDTLSGSRPASSAAASWSVIHALGKEGFTEIIKKELELKHYFINLLDAHKNELPTHLITHPESNILAVHFKSLSEFRIPKPLEKKYSLKPSIIADERGGGRYYYTIIFMPHVTKRALAEFVADLT